VQCLQCSYIFSLYSKQTAIIVENQLEKRKIQAANNNLGPEITERRDIYIPIPCIQQDCEKDAALMHVKLKVKLTVMLDCCHGKI